MNNRLHGIALFMGLSKLFDTLKQKCSTYCSSMLRDWCRPHLRYYLNNRFVNVKAFSSFSDKKIIKYGENCVFFDFKGVKARNVRLSI